MKRIITLFTLCVCAGMIYGQDPAMKIDANGNVGIGTATPQNKLHIKDGSVIFEPTVGGNGRSTLNMKSISASTRFQFQSGDGTSDSWSYFTMFGDENNNATNRRGEVAFSGDYHRFFTGVTDAAGGSQFGTESMRLTSDGKLAVGQTTVPAAHVAAFNGTIQVNGTTIGSDRKLKSDIRSFDYGLDEVMRMSPKFYHYNGDILQDDGIKAGIIAQEFQKIIPEAVVEVDYQKHDMENQVIEEGTYLAVNTDMIRFALVNALQEQQTMIDDLRTENEELRAMINKVITSLDTDNQIDATLSGKTASLDQNAPNPFKGQTELRYVIPADAQNARMVITSNAGQVIKTINIAHTGNGVINLTGNDIPAGNYHYTLVVDGNQVDTKTMTLVN